MKTLEINRRFTDASVSLEIKDVREFILRLQIIVRPLGIITMLEFLKNRTFFMHPSRPFVIKESFPLQLHYATRTMLLVYEL